MDAKVSTNTKTFQNLNKNCPLYKPYVSVFIKSIFFKFSLLKKVLTFALRIGSICLVLSDLLHTEQLNIFSSLSYLRHEYKELSYPLSFGSLFLLCFSSNHRNGILLHALKIQFQVVLSCLIQ